MIADGRILLTSKFSDFIFVLLPLLSLWEMTPADWFSFVSCRELNALYLSDIIFLLN